MFVVNLAAADFLLLFGNNYLGIIMLTAAADDWLTIVYFKKKFQKKLYFKQWLVIIWCVCVQLFQPLWERERERLKQKAVLLHYEVKIYKKKVFFTLRFRVKVVITFLS